MLKILFFGQVKEQLECAELDLQWSGASLDLDGLQEQLCADNPPVWRDVLEQENLIRAVNQTVAKDNCSLSDGDEIAFFPPVTGG